MTAYDLSRMLSITLQLNKGEILINEILLDILVNADIFPSNIYLWVESQFISKSTPKVPRGGKLGEVKALISLVLSF